MAAITPGDKKFTPRLNNFKFLQFAVWSNVACFNPYIVVFLMNRNASTVMIGTILMLNSFVSLLGQPFWGMVSDRIQSVKRVFILCFSTAAALIILLPFCRDLKVLAFLLPFIMFFFSSLSPLLDSWTIQGIKNDKSKSYGAFRMWGSFGFSIMVIIVGKVIDITSINSAFIMFGVMSCMTITICVNFVNASRRNTDDEQNKARPFRVSQLGMLFKNYYYVTFLILSCMLFVTLSSVFSFLPTLMKQVGGSDQLYGLAMAVSAFSEVPVLYLSQRLIRKYKPLTLILAAILVYILRLFIYSMAGSPLIVIMTQALNGFSYGLFLTGSVYYIDYLAPDELKATAQTTATAVYFSLSGIVGNYMTGRLIESFGTFFVYRLGAFIDILVFILFLLSLFIGRWLQNTKPSLMKYSTPVL